MIEAFAPIYNQFSEILILGSFPSVISRKNNFYYSNKQNRFWKTLEYCYKDSVGNSSCDKTNFLLNNKLALWDIVSFCEIEGSSDISIKNYAVADLSIILHNAPIRKILCNGIKAYDLTIKQYSSLDIPIIKLPSTSPANTRFDILVWRKALLD